MIKIFDSTVSLIGVVAAYDDFVFKRGWNDPGEFSFQTDWTATYAAVLVEGNIIYVDANHAGWIDTVTITRKGNTDVIEVSGIELKDMLSWRYTDNGHVGFTFTSKTPEYTVKQLIQYNIGSSASASRKIDEVSIVASAGKGTAIDLTSYHKRLDEEVYALLKPDGLGLSATLDVTNQLIVFDVLAGTDMTAGQSTNNRVMLNVDMGTLDAITYKESTVGYANFAYVGGQGEGNDRTIVDVGTATGATRRETFVDARDISSAAELTDRGEQKLAEVEQSEIINCDVRDFGTYDYITDYDIGDFVTVIDSKVGISQDMQIASATETYTAGKPLAIKIALGRDVSSVQHLLSTALQASKAAVVNGVSNNGWDKSGVWTYASATTITVADGTKFNQGYKLRWYQSGYKYAYVVGISGNTLTLLGGAVANAAISDTYFSTADNPSGFPAYFEYTSTLTGLSSISNAVFRYRITKGVIHLSAGLIGGVSNATTFTFTVPIVHVTHGNASPRIPVFCRDGGTDQSTPAYLSFNSGSTIVTANKTVSSVAWTNSGQKFIFCGHGIEYDVW